MYLIFKYIEATYIKIIMKILYMEWNVKIIYGISLLKNAMCLTRIKFSLNL